MNKESITRLITFEDEGTDTSTGYVSTNNNTRQWEVLYNGIQPAVDEIIRKQVKCLKAMLDSTPDKVIICQEPYEFNWCLLGMCCVGAMYDSNGEPCFVSSEVGYFYKNQGSLVDNKDFRLVFYDLNEDKEEYADTTFGLSFRKPSDISSKDVVECFKSVAESLFNE